MRSELYADMEALEKKHFWFCARREILQACLKLYVLHEKNNLIFDAGCGTGANIDALKEFGEVYGQDLCFDACTYAAPKYHNILLQGRLEKLPVREDVFDVSALLDVLEHVDDQKMVLREIYRILKPNGMLLLTVPAFMHLWSAHDLSHQHRRRYLKKEIHTLLESSGFEIKYLSYFNTHLYPIIAVARLLSRRLGIDRPSDMKMPLSLLNKIMCGIFACEKFWIGRLSAPYGVSLVAVAEKRSE